MPKTVQFTKGSIIFFEGDKNENIYILQSGSIVLKSLDMETGEQIQEQLHIGEFFGVKSALAHMPALVTASVVVDSVVVLMSINEFEKIFSAKLEVIEKMLRVFSRSLRDIHKKMEEFFKTDAVAVSPERGMMLVAQAFYNDGQFTSCVNVLERIIKLKPDAAIERQVIALYKDAKGRAEREKKNNTYTTVAPTQKSGLAANQFNFPAFDRFTKKYAPGEVIISEYEPGETFYLIKRGEVQISKCIKDQNKNLDILTQGAFFGEMAILDNSQRSASCVARTEVECLEFNRANFKALVLGNPQIVMNLLKLFCKRIYDQKRQFKIILIKNISVRICDVILMYDELSGSSRRDPVEGNTRRTFNVTVSDIAGWAAVGQDVARDELTKLMDRGRVQIFDNRLIVNNIHDIRRSVDSYYQKLEANAKFLTRNSE